MARLVLEGILPEATAKAVLAKSRELAERGRPLSAAEICRRKGFLTPTELRWLEDMDAPPADLLPGYTLLGTLGRGGQSRVYRVTELASGRSLAMKVLLPGLRRQELARERFLAEGRLLISLDHENIVRGEELAEHDGLVYLLMESVEGETALERMEREGAFSEDDALRILLATARALSYLHERGAVHRDVKPDNILLGHDGSVKLGDLGLAATESQGDGETTAGTVEYLSPEQAQGAGGLDVRSDVYSLGISLFHLVVGSLPFEADTDQETMLRRILEELRSPELKGMNVSPHMNYFIKKMTARDPEVRYQSAPQLIADIEEQLGGREALTPRKSPAPAPKPPPPAEVVRRRDPRRRPGGR
jgi:serine/threonine-protein kinase